MVLKVMKAAEVALSAVEQVEKRWGVPSRDVRAGRCAREAQNQSKNWTPPV